MSKGKSLGLAFLASAVMAAPAYGQTYGGRGEQVICTRDSNTGAVVCPEQQQRVYAPTGPAQPRPQVVVEQPNPVVAAVVGTALVLGAAALFNRGHGGGHHRSHGYPVWQPVQPADIYYPDGYGCMRTARGSVRCPGY